MANSIDRPKKKVLSLGGLMEIKAMKKDLLDSSGIDLTVLEFINIAFFIEPREVSITLPDSSLSDFNFVWLHAFWATRDIAFALSTLLAYLRIPHNSVEPDHSKLTDYVTLALNNCAMPKSYFARNQKLRKSYDEVVEYLGLPIVIKSCRSSWGRGVYLAKNEDEFVRITKKLPLNNSYVCQQFIPNKFDYRAMISYGEIVSTEKRIRQEGTGEFRNNTHQGGREVFFPPSELPKEVAELSLKAAKVLNLEWCGVDIVPDLEEKHFYVLEVNRNPGTTAGSPEVPAALEHLKKLVRKVQP